MNENHNYLCVVEFKVKNELFVKKFVYDSKCSDGIDGFIYINSSQSQELTINRNFIEYRIERPMLRDEELEDSINRYKKN